MSDIFTFKCYSFLAVYCLSKTIPQRRPYGIKLDRVYRYTGMITDPLLTSPTVLSKKKW